jgi:hypothetical protein
LEVVSQHVGFELRRDTLFDHCLKGGNERLRVPPIDVSKGIPTAVGIRMRPADQQGIDPLGGILRHAQPNPPTHGIAKEVGLWDG